MDGEDIESLVNTHVELQLGRKVAADAAHNAENHGGPGSDVTGGGSNSDQTADSAGAETNHGPLLLKAVVEQGPSNTSNGSSQVSNDAGHDSAEVSGESGTTVETEPTNPEEYSSEDDVGDVVGSVRQTGVLGVASSLANHDGEGEGRGTGRDVDGGTAGKVKAAHLEGPAVGVPGPVRDGVVHDSGPDEHEDDAR